MEERETFSIGKRIQSFVHAGRGLALFFRTTHNVWLHIGMFVLVMTLGFYFSITTDEWIAVVLAGGLVFVAEAFNTAIEIDIDLTSPTYHPYARDTKDVAAGAVLIASLVAAIVGCIVFVPYVIARFF